MTLHTPVLLNEVSTFLAPVEGKTFIDCTLGYGGHALALAKKVGSTGAVYGIDVDQRNLLLAKERISAELPGHTNVHFIRDNFENLGQIITRVIAERGSVDGILFDLGLSSLHVDTPERGFSFQTEGPLDMRFDERAGITAADIVNTYSIGDLTSLFRIYGEEPHALRIAHKIVDARKRRRFATTTELAACIADGLLVGDTRPGKRAARPRAPERKPFFKRHPATRVFQALRVATNREIEVLQAGLMAAIQGISIGGRIVVISYHSLEDRIVKTVFRSHAQDGILKLLTKKPLVPQEAELVENRRSRSAKLRAVEKI